MNCRLCNSNKLNEYLNLGFTPPSDQFLRKDQLSYSENYYPLAVNLCMDCGLSQLSYIVSPEILYRNDYPYESSITKTGNVHWEKFAEHTVKKFSLGKKDLVVDIGSNVGTLLSKFKNFDTKVYGVDPAANIVMKAINNGIDTECDFFNSEVVEKILMKKGEASVITCTNCFAHIDNLNELVQNVKKLLNRNGVFIFESPHIKNLIEKIEYDTIYHEHLSYLSLKPLINFFKTHGLEVFDVINTDIHGGSFRVFIGNTGEYKVSSNVTDFIKEEEDLKVFDFNFLKSFQIKVDKNKQDLVTLLYDLKLKGKKIAAVSAPAKGMTLLNYCKIDESLIDFVTEKSELKIGRYTPGQHIPVVPDNKLIEKEIDYALILAWNFSSEIMSNLKDYKDRGGKFIIPIPHPKIL